ncbi:hypothetical protein HED60_19330 [Planctomycetales bacterium ZRK34]|nr:hypothetical protein HED60_19330 [Planctomycetales bacterium ZRK34]
MAFETARLIKWSSSKTTDGLTTALTVSEQYQVISTDPSGDSPINVYNASGLPSIGDSYSGGNGLKVVAINPDRVKATDNLKEYIINVEYDRTTTDGNIPENPLSRPPRIRVDGSLSNEPYFIDSENTKVLNTAGRPFPDQPQRDKHISSITVTANVSGYDLGTIQTYSNTYNSAGINISDGNNTINIPQYQGKIGAITASEKKIESEIEYYEITIPIDIYSGPNAGWHEDKYLSVGLIQLVSSEPKKIEINGEPVDTPEPLDSNGAHLPGGPPAEVTFVPYAASSWSGLSFT